MNISDLLVWVDCEMTGLDISRDELLEIAVVITGFDLKPLDDGLQLLVAPSSPELLSNMEPNVTAMHRNSGLLGEISAGGGLAAAEVDQQVSDYVESHLKAREGSLGETSGEKYVGLLAGNSVATDRLFITRYLPRVSGLLHYRMVDVTAVKELARRWYPAEFEGAPAKHGEHRAQNDILNSVAELRYWQENIFKSNIL